MTRPAYESILDTIGDTPLVKLHRTGPGNGSSIFVKCEFFNPLSSVKDRIGLAMIEAGERAGHVDKNTHIIEPTSGNTGIALAFVCAAKGYKLTLTMPDSMSVERRALLRMLGAELVLTEGAKGMSGAIAKAAELVGTSDNAWMPQQFENPANPQAHYETTGPEIWEATGGKVTHLVHGVGTGGCLSGAGQYLKEQNPDVKVVAVEPTDSPVISGGEPGPHKIQGIGAGFIPKNLNKEILDGIEKVSNDEAFEWARKISEHEGVLGGISTGANVCASVRIAEKDPSAHIVTIGCSFGERYLSTPLFEGLR